MTVQEIEGATGDLVRAAARGDVAAFSELARRESARLVRTARALVRDGHEAEDLAQDALVAAFRNLGSLREPARFRAWLATILTRLALRQRKRPRPVLVGEGMERTPARPDVRHPRLESLAAEVRRLPDRLRVPLSLFYLAELSYREVAEATGLTEKLVKSRLHKARERLRRRMR